MTRKDMEKVVQDMIAAKSCYPVLRARGEEWLNAGDTDTEEAAWKKLVAQAKVDIMPIDDLISFAASKTGAKVLGKEGAEYCDCPACKGAAIVIEYENLYD